MKTIGRALMVGLILIIGTGCATIVDSGRKSVEIKTNPPGAQVTIINKKNETVSTNTTPTIVKLKRGGFYSTAHYTLRFEYPGYYPSELQVHSVLNGWYLGNLIFGGAVGLVIVDPATGAMWTLSPRHINWNMVPHTSELSSNELKAAELQLNPPPAKSSTVKSGK